MTDVPLFDDGGTSASATYSTTSTSTPPAAGESSSGRSVDVGLGPSLTYHTSSGNAVTLGKDELQVLIALAQVLLTAIVLYRQVSDS